jgi:hypothetical protein
MRTSLDGAGGEWEATAIHGITDAMVKARCLYPARLQVRPGHAHRALGNAETTVNLILGTDPLFLRQWPFSAQCLSWFCGEWIRFQW